MIHIKELNNTSVSNPDIYLKSLCRLEYYSVVAELFVNLSEFMKSHSCSAINISFYDFNMLNNK
jgi:hypothetical protein